MSSCWIGPARWYVALVLGVPLYVPVMGLFCTLAFPVQLLIYASCLRRRRRSWSELCRAAFNRVLFMLELSPFAYVHDALCLGIRQATSQKQALYARIPERAGSTNQKTPLLRPGSPIASFHLVKNLPRDEKVGDSRTHIRIVFISDPHQKLRFLEIPDGDVLCICGDVLLRNGFWFGASNAFQEFKRVLLSLPHKYKIFIAGNHDAKIESLGKKAVERSLPGVIYLENSSTVVEGIKFYGCPYSPLSRSRNSAFQMEKKDALEVVMKIPVDTDVLITHANDSLTDEVVRKVQPLIHAYGHFHADYGVRQKGSTLSINACSVDGYYRAVNPSIVVDIERKR
mmetsp:Transcript_40046/g.65122  ORF Transcript_40046/g.65122 Transcript_40046/m.65122 type:complete len:341 (-) Transcript_40046:132-1154(-)